MDKLKMMSKDITQENIKKIQGLFPQAVTEVLRNGQPTLAVDFDVLKQELSSSLIDDREQRYQFTWPDKKKSGMLAYAPTTNTLRPCKEESVDFDNTQNLYIEGDNLEVLKLLRETYLGQVKMIYIDPPYNTGNDFIYEDDFAIESEKWRVESGDYDEEGNRMVKNLDSNGRFHTDWLNMIYPRLKLARDLLTDDGAIFIHIDDNEVENLLKICNEIFGEDNYINLISVKTKVGGVSGSSEGKSLKGATEYICAYCKDKNSLLFAPVFIKTKLFSRIKSYELDGKSWKYTSVLAHLGGKILLKEDKQRGIKYYGYKEVETMSISSFASMKGISEEDVYNHYANLIFQTTNAQSSVRQTVIRELNEYDYPMFGCEYKPIKGKNEGNLIEILYKGEQRRMMMFLSDAVEFIDGEYYYLDKITTLWDDIDYNNLTKEGEIEFANGKKPIKLLQRLMSLITDNDSIVLDFFSGSATTAHAVMQLNAEDGGNRKFIMVQVPEPCAENSEAYKAGYKNICEIGKERIRRAGKKILNESGELRVESGVKVDNNMTTTQHSTLHSQNLKLDIGFRVLKLDSSNMKDVYYKPEDYRQDLLTDLTDNIVHDRTPLDLLFQVMLELGLMLSSKIEEKEIDFKSEELRVESGNNGNSTAFQLSTLHTPLSNASYKVYIVNDNDLIACFDKDVTEDVVKQIALKKPLYAAFRDSSLASDSVNANFDQIFATYSPTTIRKVL
jgi:adenine-specific DNA-methyltransferase